MALFKDDLKSVLAYSTVSHLGMMTMLLGFSTTAAVVACLFHIINHAAFKAALFLNMGIIDHETGTRDINDLGGLRRFMPATALFGLLAAAAMAGLPPMNGFLSKELMLEQSTHVVFAGTTFLLPIAVTIASIFSCAYSLRYFFHVFGGKPRKQYATNVHDPGPGLWLSPALLVGLAVLLGLFPETLVGDLLRAVTSVVTGGSVPDFKLSLWHGITPALIMSAVAVVMGATLLLSYKPARNFWNQLPELAAKPVFDRAIEHCSRVARRINDTVHNGSLSRYLFMTLMTCVLVCGATWIQNWGGLPTERRETLPVNLVLLIGWLILIAGCYLVVIKHRERLVALLLVNMVGLFNALIFVYFSAPDLALTQISVEVVTLVLMLLALNFFPKQCSEQITKYKRNLNAALSIVIGLGMGGLMWSVLTTSSDSISNFYWEQSIPGSGGRNVVNVILVDFRGFDTFGEIMVLGISALIILAMMDGMLKGPVRQRLATWTSGQRYSPIRHPLMMIVVTRLMLPLSLVVAAFIFLRGHNLPGGGFIAALVVSIALIMQYMSSGMRWTSPRLQYDYQTLIGGGVLVAAATGVAAMVFDLPFLTSGFHHFHWPLVGEFELSSAMAFDLGIFVTVVGAVMLALAQLPRLGEQVGHGSSSLQPDGACDNPKD